MLSASIGLALIGGGAYGATSWGVALAGGSSGRVESAAVSDLTITAVSSPRPANLLFPGGAGDVVVSINNPNSFSVTVTGVDLPSATTFAQGFTDPALSVPAAGCSSNTSEVDWSHAQSQGGTAHSLTDPLTIAAASSLVVTLAGAASMFTTTPGACAGVYFQMPALDGIVATSGGTAPTAGPTSDGWDS